MDAQAIKHLISGHRPGYALEQDFYQDADIYTRDIEQIYMKSWLYAGHASEIPRVGDYFLFNFDTESVIVIRNDVAEFSALVNVCRHRGSRVCLEAAGKASRLTCRYHGWTYALNGELLGAAQMPDSFDKTRNSLKRIHLRCLQGMIFVNFADQPASFDPIEDDLTDCLRPYRIDRAKVAHRQSYPIAANWKLAVENYCECYHCASAHPEYSRGHGLAIPEEHYADELRDVMARAASCGLSEKVVTNFYLHSGETGTDRSYERYPLLRGHVTGSEDGKPVAPLLGDIVDYDGGATDFQVGPVTYALAYCDHVVVYRFTPLSVHSTDCDITWLVNESAEEGKDYDLKKLTWLWDVTTIADQHIIERNQEGVNSRFYEPGPYSKMEDFTQVFVDWYVKTIAV
ncbi:MAG: aromatic ring-hydroxylating dioxygenase subunit alpha [Gammaproteobacteria bacterium]|nr:aromatic ring-hydroxylating dioxygenase subunit alpha [Gammaproteobacteria bacterium]